MVSVQAVSTTFSQENIKFAGIIGISCSEEICMPLKKHGCLFVFVVNLSVMFVFSIGSFKVLTAN